MIARAVSILLLMTVACTGATPEAGGGPEIGDAGPCLVVVRRDHTTPLRSSGLLLAVWLDGTMLFSPDPLRPGRHLLVGELPRDDVRELILTAERAGFFQTEREDYVVPDAGWTEIGARSDGGVAIHLPSARPSTIPAH